MHILGGASDHIKGIYSTPIPHQSKTAMMGKWTNIACMRYYAGENTVFTYIFLAVHFFQQVLLGLLCRGFPLNRVDLFFLVGLLDQECRLFPTCPVYPLNLVHLLFHLCQALHQLLSFQSFLEVLLLQECPTKYIINERGKWSGKEREGIKERRGECVRESERGRVRVRLQLLWCSKSALTGPH